MRSEKRSTESQMGTRLANRKDYGQRKLSKPSNIKGLIRRFYLNDKIHDEAYKNTEAVILKCR